jgi:two-component system NtrC family sensor kinase
MASYSEPGQFPPSHTLEDSAMALAAHACALFDGSLAIYCRRTDRGLEPLGYSASTPALAAAVCERHMAGSYRILPELPLRAMELCRSIAVRAASISPDVPGFDNSGQVLLTPVQTPSCPGVLLVYGRPEAAFDEKDTMLADSLASLAAETIGNAVVSGRSGSESRDLHRVQAMIAELRTLDDFEDLLKSVVQNAAGFLDCSIALIGLVEDGVCRLRCVAENGSTRLMDEPVREGICHQRLIRNQPCWSNDGLPEVQHILDLANEGNQQFLTVPVQNSNGVVTGVLGLLESDANRLFHKEDISRAELFAAEVEPVLRAAQELRAVRQQRRYAEELAYLALQVNSTWLLSDWVQRFAERTSELVSARAAALALARGRMLETVVLYESALRPHDPAMLRELNAALTLSISCSSCTNEGPAEELLGSKVAASFGWKSVTLVRLDARDGSLLGILCLADCRELHSAERNMLQALSVQASLALENARLYTCMEQANRHWTEIFDSITDFVVVHDEEQNVLRVNRSLADFIGAQPEQLIGVNMRALVSMMPEAVPMQGCPFCEQNAKANDDFLYHVLDHTYMVSTLQVQETLLNDGAQTIHVLKDITDRCEAERRYRELFDSLQEGLYFASPEGRFVEVNDALVRMLGYDSREELLQVDIPSQLYIVPRHWERFVEAVESGGTGLRNFEERLRRKDGSAIHMLQNAFAIRDTQGRIIQYRGLMLDITDLKNYQAELQRERDFSSKILNHTQSMILVVDTAGLVSYANRRCCEAGHYEESGLLGRRLVELVMEQRRNQMAHAVEMCLLGQQVDNLELPILMGDGHAGQFSINLSPMRDDKGNINSIVVVMTDITDASMLKAKLIHTEKMAAVGQLVSGVAHEVNNPLTAVLGFADLLLENPEVPESAKKEIAVILQEAQRTKQIVQNLLSFARQTPPQRRPMNVNDVLRRTLALRAYDFTNHDIDVIERLDTGVRNVVGDAHQLQQVFLNILNNAYDAVKETGSRGRIEIESGMNGDTVEVRFRDNGPGVLQPDRIFDPFFTTKEVGKGTGLGLSICYGIVHEHGGDISCQNNGSVPGAMFTVRLPAGAKSAAAAGGAS